ncbi:class I tRNA ligase family protein [Kribbella sp. NPDC050241]|uniref:class I tRNA ligase family protein n=1 Tax=Kribbella sp. NPDC050241 TaxID=3364115 RepID=UPI003794BA6C
MITSTGVTVVVVPPATANGPLHVGHLSGPYLAADIAARAARARGERVVTTAGFDVHQNWVLTRAEKEGVDVEKLAAAYRDEIVEALDAARIQYDVFLDPQSTAYQHGVTTLAADLTEAGRFPMRRLTLLACEDCGRTLHQSYVVGTCAWCGSEAAGGGCEGCGGYTSAENLVDPVCNRCGGAPKPFQANVPVLSMEDYRQELIEIWLRAELPDRARRIVTHYLEHRLPDIPIAYPTNWGLRGTGPHEGLRLEVYAEVGLSTVYGVAQSLQPGALGLEATSRAWSEVGALWHFNGIDNGFYFALFWPAVYLACGVPPEAIGGAQVNEFYTLDGSKFSTSRNHAIWANDFLHDEDVDIVRLYLAWDRPDRYASDFTVSSYREFEAYVRPLLDGAVKTSAVPAVLAEEDVKRGAAALRPRGFDPALAVRSALTGLAASAPGVDQLLSILIGR